MWFSTTATKMIQQYLNIYSQIKMHFDAQGNVKTVATLHNGNWIHNPAIATKINMEMQVVPIGKSASMIFKK